MDIFNVLTLEVAHRVPHMPEGRLDGIRHAMRLTEDAAVIQSYRLLAHALVERLRDTLQAIARFDQEIAAVAPTLPDYSLFNTLPGSARY
jgi:hypothetical protein